MKKKKIILSLAFAASIASCQEQKQDDWIEGSEGGKVRDTTIHGNSYRHYHGAWFPIIGGMISPSTFRGAGISDISRPGFTPGRTGVRSGGFGRSSHSSAAT